MNVLFSILKPLEWMIAWLLTVLHSVLTLIGLPCGPSPAWCLSIVLMTMIIRLCLLPLFVTQMRAARRAQLIQPQLQRIQRMYQNRKDAVSVEAMRRETAALYREHHASPMGSCLPSLIQGPILCSLYYVLSALPAIASGARPAIGGIDEGVAADIERSVFVNVRLSDTMTSAAGGARLTIGITVALMCMAMFAMQWLLIHRNTPLETLDDPRMRTQKAVSFILPVVYVFSGMAMPYGVLLYWVTSNLWNLGQTLCQLHWFPAPGSAAGERKTAHDHTRENARRSALGLPSIEEQAIAESKAVAAARRDREHRRGPGRRNGRRAHRGRR